jgi:nitrogen fixation/metabolism regulation signal transduction histidine kinase
MDGRLLGAGKHGHHGHDRSRCCGYRAGTLGCLLMEEMEYGASRNRHPRLLMAAVVVFALVLAAAWWLDRRWQESSTDAVALATEQAETALANAQRRIGSMREYVRPAISRPDLDPQVRASMDDLVQEARAQGLLELALAREELATLTFAPWHDGPRTLRDDALATLDAAVAELGDDNGDIVTLIDTTPASG